MRGLRTALFVVGFCLVVAGLLWPESAPEPSSARPAAGGFEKPTITGTTGTGLELEARLGRELAPGIYEQEKVFTFQGMKIDKIYASMQGPWARTHTQLAPEYAGSHVWLTRYRAVVVEPGNDSAQQFMCHTNLAVAGGLTPTRDYFSIAQGQNELSLPAGFGMRIENSAKRRIDVIAKKIGGLEG